MLSLVPMAFCVPEHRLWVQVSRWIWAGICSSTGGLLHQHSEPTSCVGEAQGAPPPSCEFQALRLPQFTSGCSDSSPRPQAQMAGTVGSPLPPVHRIPVPLIVPHSRPVLDGVPFSPLGQSLPLEACFASNNNNMVLAAGVSCEYWMGSHLQGTHRHWLVLLLVPAASSMKHNLISPSSLSDSFCSGMKLMASYMASSVSLGVTNPGTVLV